MGALLDILRGQVGAGVPLDLLRPTRTRMTKPVVIGRGRRNATYLSDTERGYNASAVAYRCVNYGATNLASLDLVVVVGDEPRPDHEISQLWNRRPNDYLSARSFKEVAFSRLELAGEQLVYLDRGDTGAGSIQGMHLVYDPFDVVVDERVGGALQGFVVKVSGGKRVPLLPGEALWLRYPDPWEPWGAMAPWKAALYAAESDAYARAWQRGEFQHGARPSSIVYLGDLEEEAHDRAVAEFEAEVAGPENAGKSLLVSGPTKAGVERLTLTPAEMSYLESRTANADEVMLAFGYRRDLFAGQATYENQRAAKVAAWSDVLVPKLEVVASETDRQLLPDLAQTAEFDVSEVEALRENADALVARAVRATAQDLVYLDEAREQLGYDPFPGGIGQQTLTAYRAQYRGAGPMEQAITASQVVLSGQRRQLLLVGRHGLRRVQVRTPVAVQARAKGRTAAGVARFYARHERIGLRAVQRLAEKQERVVLRRLRDLLRHRPDVATGWALAAETTRIGASPWTQLPVSHPLRGMGYRVAADDVLDAEYWRGQTQEYLQAFMAGVWEGGADNAADLLGISLDQFDTAVIDAMRVRGEVLAGQVTETTRQVIDAQLLQAGVEGGESVDQLADRIKGVYADLAGWRATMIARTETVGGFNAASRQGALASGAVAGRTWLAAHDDRVRESHSAMDGETVNGMAGAYSNGLLHPGDPNGHPSETVNCRCVETYVLED